MFERIDWFRHPTSARAARFFREEPEAARWKEQLEGPSPPEERRRGSTVLDRLGDLATVEVGVVLDLLSSSAARGANQDIVDLVEPRLGPTVGPMTWCASSTPLRSTASDDGRRRSRSSPS